MATVEGVSRRIDPDNDIWAAARPVVERWIARELSPASQARDLVAQGRRALEGLARWAESPPTLSQPTVVMQKPTAVAPAALVVAATAFAVAAAALGIVLSLLLI
jgi:ubiquinone biosynthesis protein